MSEDSFSKLRPGKKPSVRPAEEGDGGASKRTGDKRERILRAAVEVFARQGFYNTRVSEVAKAAGVADGTIYLYFESKDQLLLSLFEDRIEKLLAFLAKEIGAIARPEEKLRRIIELQLGLLDGERELAEVVTIIVRQSNTLLREHAAPKFVAYLDAIASVVAQGQREGTFRADISPHLVARAVFGALDGIALTWALGKPEVGALKRSASQLAALVLGGIRSGAENPVSKPPASP